LVSQAEFDRVQVLIRQKAERSIRMRQQVGQFVYSGFCWCSKCGARLHTHRNQLDNFYYLCVGKKRRNEAGELLCRYTGYMNRDRFGPVLDQLFSEQLTDRTFLRRVYDYQMAQFERDGSEARLVRLRSNIGRLDAKRQRINDLYLDGELSREEHRARLAQLDRELRQAKTLLEAEAPAPVVDAATLAQVFAPFLEWRFLKREQKRRMLSSLGPQIIAADYQVESLTLDGDMISHRKTARFASPAPPCR
jgi:hypothetical protein